MQLMDLLSCVSKYTCVCLNDKNETLDLISSNGSLCTCAKTGIKGRVWQRNSILKKLETVKILCNSGNAVFVFKVHK